MKKVGFIGMGNMASAIAGGIIKSGFISGDLVYAFDIDNSKLDAVNKTYGINGCTSEQELVNQVDIVIMAVKPNIVESVINKIKENLHNKAMISIVAGYNNDRYNELLLPSSRHLTVMPNTPALVLKGMTLLETILCVLCIILGVYISRIPDAIKNFRSSKMFKAVKVLNKMRSDLSNQVCQSVD